MGGGLGVRASPPVSRLFGRCSSGRQRQRRQRPPIGSRKRVASADDSAPADVQRLEVVRHPQRAPNALKGQSLKSVNTWMVVNILATYWVAGKDGNAAAAKELGIPAHFEGPSQGQLSTQVSEYETSLAPGPTACSRR